MRARRHDDSDSDEDADLAHLISSDSEGDEVLSNRYKPHNMLTIPPKGHSQSSVIAGVRRMYSRASERIFDVQAHCKGGNLNGLARDLKKLGVTYHTHIIETQPRVLPDTSRLVCTAKSATAFVQVGIAEPG